MAAARMISRLYIMHNVVALRSLALDAWEYTFCMPIPSDALVGISPLLLAFKDQVIGGLLDVKAAWGTHAETPATQRVSALCPWSTKSPPMAGTYGKAGPSSGSHTEAYTRTSVSTIPGVAYTLSVVSATFAAPRLTFPSRSMATYSAVTASLPIKNRCLPLAPLMEAHWCIRRPPCPT